MAKKKIKLTDLKVKSFVTELNKEETNATKGGYLPRVGTAFKNKISFWTEHDIRFGMTDTTKDIKR